MHCRTSINVFQLTPDRDPAQISFRRQNNRSIRNFVRMTQMDYRHHLHTESCFCSAHQADLRELHVAAMARPQPSRRANATAYADFRILRRSHLMESRQKLPAGQHRQDATLYSSEGAFCEILLTSIEYTAVVNYVRAPAMMSGLILPVA